jgi:MYXO-CTERM domain-containing protein
MSALLLLWIVGGAPDATSAVVEVYPTCSGVVVAPTIVLTAAHCARSASSVIVDGQTFQIARRHLYPDYSGATSDELAGLDLAAIELAADPHITPMPFAHTTPLAGAATAIGLGSGQREAVAVGMQVPCERLIGFGDATHGTQGGDSGGALVAGGELVGIISYQTETTPPDFAVRTDPYARWIDSIIAGNADDRCASTCPPAASNCFHATPQDSGCACAVGSGGTPSLLAVMLLWLLRRR